jgi:glycosyltransferase involved in cell wall biosynthesis
MESASRPERTQRVLFLMNRWSSSAGGIQTVNRELACAVAKQFSHIGCVALVTQATPAERENADARGVTLVAGTVEDDWASAVLSPGLAEIPAQDVIAVVGHSYFSGYEAVCLRKRFFPWSIGVHFVHMSPLDTEYLKEYRNDSYVVTRENRMKREIQIALASDIVICIGPRLWRYMSDSLRAHEFSGPVLRLDCGLNPERYKRSTFPIHPTLLCLGRTESLGIRGLDVFASAAGHLTKLWRAHPSTKEKPPPRFFVRGAKDDIEALESKLTEIASSIHSNTRIVVKPYTSDRAELEAEFRAASIFVMPSREEGFGLVACEALSLGVPVIVTSESGVAEMIKEVANRSHTRTDLCIVDSRGGISDEIGPRYAEIALKILSDESAADAYFVELREKMSPFCSWTAGATSLIEYIYKNTRPRPSSPGKFSVVEVSPEYTTAERIYFKSKVRIVLQNDTGQAIDILNPTWIANGNVRLDLPPQLKLQVELVEGGRRSNEWSDEVREVRVPPGWAFRTWIGLHSPLSNTAFDNIRDNRQFGTLLLTIRGDENKVKIPV